MTFRTRKPVGQRAILESLRGSIVVSCQARGALALGDLAVIDDLRPAFQAGVDAVGTTLSGYAAESSWQSGPDFVLMTELVKHSPVPVFGEGCFWTPDQVVRAFEIGATFVVMGTTITNPMAITSRFISAIESWTPDEG